LGYKGVVVIDEQLDKTGNGIQMRLRDSMRKFDVSDDHEAPIEIAQAFERPNVCYLNRHGRLLRVLSIASCTDLVI
jgi:RNA-dependent RNA polymerase